MLYLFFFTPFLLCGKQMDILSLYFLLALICFCFVLFFLCSVISRRKSCRNIWSRCSEIYALFLFVFLLCGKQKEILSQNMIRKNCQSLSRPEKASDLNICSMFSVFFALWKAEGNSVARNIRGKISAFSIYYAFVMFFYPVKLYGRLYTSSWSLLLCEKQRGKSFARYKVRK